jgi:hypothetical protein
MINQIAFLLVEARALCPSRSEDCKSLRHQSIKHVISKVLIWGAFKSRAYLHGLTKIEATTKIPLPWHLWRLQHLRPRCQVRCRIYFVTRRHKVACKEIGVKHLIQYWNVLSNLTWWVLCWMDAMDERRETSPSVGGCHATRGANTASFTTSNTLFLPHNLLGTWLCNYCLPHRLLLYKVRWFSRIWCTKTSDLRGLRIKYDAWLRPLEADRVLTLPSTLPSIAIYMWGMNETHHHEESWRLVLLLKKRR